jgi:hypothetical protein
VWDYAGEMTMLRAFWEAALELDPERAGPLDEATRFPDCNPDRLAALWTEAGFEQISTAGLVVGALYEDFDELWTPFTEGVGPAGSYCAALGDDDRAALATAFHERLGSPSGSFELSARAWMVAGSD